jgi:hypothetical protein
MKYIKSIGIELEGGFYNCEDGDYFYQEVVNKKDWSSRFKWGNDGSVNLGEDYYYSDVELKFWSYDINEILDFVKFAFDCNFEQNRSCGNHIHIRTKRKDYYDLMSNEEFFDVFIDEYKKKFKDRKKFLNRLYHNYCTVENLSERIKNQIKKETSYRYTAINFLSLKEEQKTLEFRILPYANDFQEYKEMFLWLIEVVERLINEFVLGERTIEKRLSIIERDNLTLIERILKRINNCEVEFKILSSKTIKI